MAELEQKKRQARKGFAEAMGAVGRRSREGKFDKKWTRDMQRVLRRFQPECVRCGATNDLTTHHLQPLSGGHGLEPGNAVRLCRACNSFIYMRDPSQLAPRMARKLETAAARFKEFWESGCTLPAVGTAGPAEETPKAPDPALIALLRAVECGDDTAIPALASWLEERGDPRASAIRGVPKVEAVVRETRTTANEVIRWVKCGGCCVGGPRAVAKTQDSLAQQIREVQSRHQSHHVRRRLGLSYSHRDTLKQYLGITPSGVAATIEEIAQRERKRVQTIRNRIELALHRLTVPNAHGCR